MCKNHSVSYRHFFYHEVILEYELRNIAKLSPSPTEALAEGWDGPYFLLIQPPRPPSPPSRSKCLYWLYLSHFWTEWAEILHDCYLGGKDEVCRQNIDPAALQYSMQRCRIYNQTVTQPFLIGLSWNLAWLLLRCKQSSYCYLGGKDEVRRQNIDRAALQ